MEISAPAPQKKVKKINWSNFLVGTCLSFATQPFEVLRTSSIINKNNSHGMSFSDLGKQALQIWKSEGMKGFYRGGVLAIIKSTAGCGIFFTGLENIRYCFDGYTENVYMKQFINFLSASGAKLGTTLILSPINVMKTRFEVVGQNEYKSIGKTIMKIGNEEGAGGFYRGILPTLMRDIPWSGLQFAIYSSMIQSYSFFFHNQRAQDNATFIFFTGAVSSGLSLLMVYPFDNIRVRYQGKKLETRSMSTLMNQVYKDQGFFGFYKGYLPRLLKKCTSGALTWTLYEKLNSTRKDTLKLH